MITGSVDSFWDALVEFAGAITSVGLVPVAFALGLHSLGLALRSVAWRNIIDAGLGDGKTPLAPVAGAVVAGVGLNGIVPARGGDVLKVFLVHKRVPQASYPMLTASLVTETLFNLAMGIVLFVWAWMAGLLPGVPELPGLSAFEVSWAAEHPAQALGILILLVTIVASVVIKHLTAAKERWRQVADGIVILRSPTRYATRVLSFQAGAWIAQLAAALFFLEAFSIEPNIRNALMVVLIQGIGSVLLVTPGGVGPKQALTVVLFADEASRPVLLAFSAGMEVLIVVFQLLLAVIAAGTFLNGFGIRDAVAHARTQIESEPTSIG